MEERGSRSPRPSDYRGAIREAVQVVVVTGGFMTGQKRRDALYNGSILSLRVVGKRYIESRERALKYTRTTSSDLVIRMSSIHHKRAND